MAWALPAGAWRRRRLRRHAAGAPLRRGKHAHAAATCGAFSCSPLCGFCERASWGGVNDPRHAQARTLRLADGPDDVHLAAIATAELKRVQAMSKL